MMVWRLPSFLEGLFSGAILNFGGVQQGLIVHLKGMDWWVFWWVVVRTLAKFSLYKGACPSWWNIDSFAKIAWCTWHWLWSMWRVSCFLLFFVNCFCQGQQGREDPWSIQSWLFALDTVLRIYACCAEHPGGIATSFFWREGQTRDQQTWVASEKRWVDSTNDFKRLFMFTLSKWSVSSLTV